MPRVSYERTTPRDLGYIDFRTGKPANPPALPVICAVIRHQRLQMGLDQKELAALIGVTKGSVGNWECGRSRPDIDLIPKICQVLRISPYTLLGMEEPDSGLTDHEQALIEKIRGLKAAFQHHMETVIDSCLSIQRAEQNTQPLYTLPDYEKPLAAGYGDPLGGSGSFTTLYLHDCPELNRADCVFHVSGDSMEPRFRNGDRVFVEETRSDLRYGEIGAFIIGNELYIKQYEADGLHSMNPEYPVMRFDSADETPVLLLGRVLGKVSPDCIAGPEEIEAFLISRPS